MSRDFFKQLFEDDDDRVVPDGGSVRVRMEFMDATQRAVASGKAVSVVDALGREAGFRPGYCFAADGSNDKARGAAEASYLMYRDRLSRAWMRNPTDHCSEHKPATSLGALRAQSEAARDAWIKRTENAWKRDYSV
jgi:hypothetical protein